MIAIHQSYLIFGGGDQWIKVKVQKGHHTQHCSYPKVCACTNIKRSSCSMLLTHECHAPISPRVTTVSFLHWMILFCHSNELIQMIFKSHLKVQHFHHNCYGMLCYCPHTCSKSKICAIFPRQTYWHHAKATALPTLYFVIFAENKINSTNMRILLMLFVYCLLFWWNSVVANSKRLKRFDILTGREGLDNIKPFLFSTDPSWLLQDYASF